MREILFRGRNKHSSEWEFGCYYKQTEFYGDEIEDHVIITSHEELSYDQALVCYSVQPETVGQFTGLTDKNGKKIFEGDIVKCRHRLYKISFEEFEDKKIRRSYGKEIEEASIGGFNCFYWRNYTVSIYDGCVRIQNGSDSHYIRKNYIYNHAIEVIGNIHDNPELLEGSDS